LTDLRHCRAETDNALQTALIPLLDGTRDRAELVAELPNSVFPADAGADAKLTLLDEALNVLARRCLLVS
jgi:hypothetical protein